MFALICNKLCSPTFKSPYACLHLLFILSKKNKITLLGNVGLDLHNMVNIPHVNWWNDHNMTKLC